MSKKIKLVFVNDQFFYLPYIWQKIAINSCAISKTSELCQTLMQFYSQLHAYCKTLKNPFHSPIRLSQTLLPNECGYYKHLYIVIHRDHTKKQTHYIYFITKKKKLMKN